MTSRDLTDWGVAIADLTTDIMLADEQHEFVLVEMQREHDETMRTFNKPFVWDTVIAGEWEPVDIEEIYITHHDNQTFAATALQAAIYALKRCDIALQDLGIDDEEFKIMTLYCEQSLRSVNDVERLW